jgi:hypothetical protein
MRYHAHMEFRIDGEWADEKYKGQTGTMAAIDFEDWTITLKMPDGEFYITGRKAVTLVNHENCDAPAGCTADTTRTEREP